MQAYLQSYDLKSGLAELLKTLKNPVRAEENRKGKNYTVGEIQSIFTSGNMVVFKIQDAKYG